MGLSTLGRQTGPDHKDLRRDTGPKKSPRPVFFLVGRVGLTVSVGCIILVVCRMGLVAFGPLHPLR